MSITHREKVIGVDGPDLDQLMIKFKETLSSGIISIDADDILALDTTHAILEENGEAKHHYLTATVIYRYHRNV